MPSDYTDLDISTFVMLFLKIYDFEPHYRYIENIARKWSFKNSVISYQSSNLKPTLVYYIYHKNEKGKPCEKDLPFVALLGEKSCFSGYNKTNNV
jgi:hypothetical protein